MDRARRSRLIKTAALCGTLAAGVDRIVKMAQMHTVTKGDTLSAIATRNGMKWQDLAKLNGITDPRKLAIGQKIQLSAPKTTPKPAARPVPRPVQPQPQVARPTPRPVARPAVQPDWAVPQPAVRQPVPQARPAAPAAQPQQQPEYSVAKGDTLSAIAARNGVNWQELARLNGITDPKKLAIGQRLKMPARPAPPTPQTPTNRMNEVSNLLHAKLNNPNLEAGVLANFDRETGGSFDYRQKERGGGGYGLPQYTGASLTAYRNWLAKTKAQDSAKSQIDYFVDQYMPTRAGYKAHMAPGASFTKEQYADWVHRKVLTPAHTIASNKAYSPSKINQVTGAHNAFMRDRIRSANGVWQGVAQ
jgi:LysM repeat protein